MGRKVVQIINFGKSNLIQANEKYSQIEKEIANGRNAQVVLVSTGSVDSLRKAYPNYFLDTQDFIREVNSIKTSHNKT